MNFDEPTNYTEFICSNETDILIFGAIHGLLINMETWKNGGVGQAWNERCWRMSINTARGHFQWGWFFFYPSPKTLHQIQHSIHLCVFRFNKKRWIKGKKSASSQLNESIPRYGRPHALHWVYPILHTLGCTLVLFYPIFNSLPGQCMCSINIDPHPAKYFLFHSNFVFFFSLWNSVFRWKNVIFEWNWNKSRFNENDSRKWITNWKMNFDYIPHFEILFSIEKTSCINWKNGIKNGFEIDFVKWMFGNFFIFVSVWTIQLFNYYCNLTF